MLEKIKDFLKKTKYFTLKYWMIIVNYIVICISYSTVYGKDDLVWTETILGLWIFVSIAYGGYKLFTKSNKV